MPERIRDAVRPAQVSRLHDRGCRYRGVQVVKVPESRPANSERRVPMKSVAVSGCTTRQTKTHITEHREVYYRWHPCFGKRVEIEQGVNKPHGAVFRCFVDAAEFPSNLEIPKWMFDRAACTLMVDKIKPNVSVDALWELQLLLQSAAPANDMVEEQRHSPKRKGDADEAPTTSTSSQSVKSVPRHSEAPAVALTTPRSTRECASVDGADAAPSSTPKRGRRRGGR